MSHRVVSLLAILVIPALTYGALQHWSAWVSTALTMAVAGVLVSLYWFMNWLGRRTTVADPTFEARIAASLDRVGLEHLTPRVVQGQGPILVRIAGGYANVALEADQLLTDAELDALLLQQAAVQPALVRHEAFRYLPWLLLFVIPIGSVLTAGRRPSVQDSVQAYSQRGGSPKHLLSGLAKSLRQASGSRRHHPDEVREIEALMGAISKE